MDYSFIKDAVRDLPDPQLVEALDRGAGQADIISLLNAEVQRSTSRVQRLREIQNALSSPMYRLLPEILSHIIFIHADDSQELYNLRWTRLLLVCKRWYEVAVHTPKLWSFIEIGRKPTDLRVSLTYRQVDVPFGREVRRIEAQRAHAGDWPLTVSINTIGMYRHEVGDREAYITTFWNPRFLLSLSVSALASPVIKTQRALAAYPHPNLQTLVIDRYESPTEVQGWESKARSLLDSILADRVPNLRSLQISNVPFSCALVKGLRTLHVEFSYAPHHPFHAGDVIGVLSRSPLLEELRLSLPTLFSSTIGAPAPRVELAHISFISLQASTDLCTQLLQALACLPCSACILVSTFFKVEAGDLESPASHLLPSYLGEHARQENAPVMRSAAVSCSDVPTGGLNFRLQRMKIVGQCRPGRRDDLYPPRFTTRTSDHDYIFSESYVPKSSGVSSMAKILHSWPLSGVVCLDIRRNADMEREWWDAQFSELPGARTIIVRPESQCVQSLITTLLAWLREGRRSSVANIIFDVENLTEPPLNMWWRPETRLNARITLMRSLSYCVDASRAGFPLDTLEIINEPAHPESRLFAPGSDFNWSELYEHLREGFVYEGILYGRDVGREGVTRNSFGAF